jgi:two-component system nitrogen regulation sensor histidine kinase NtrY
MSKHKLIPSFRTQIFLVFLLLLFLSVVFTRSFFIKSFEPFLQRLSGLNVDRQLADIHKKYSPALPDDIRNSFAHDIENLMVNQKQFDLAVSLYRQRIAAYSIYIAVFVVIALLLIFLLTISLITRPLRRLQNATQEIMAGNINIQIKENRFSPINDLIVSFNTMVRELEIQRQRAIEAEKQIVWREIARVMAHEIKNPLTPIKLTVERLEIKRATDPDKLTDIIKDSINIIKEETENLQALVNRFRNFATLPQATPDKYRLDHQLQEIIDAYRAEYNISLDISISSPHIYADKIQLKQVFVNLIQNAIQSFRSGNETITIMLRQQNNTFNITIQDSGPGISPENLKKIFEPYFTTKRKGTGLGLAIVKRIIENHGGSISIDSNVGVGTKINITLPRKQIMES